MLTMPARLGCHRPVWTRATSGACSSVTVTSRRLPRFGGAEPGGTVLGAVGLRPGWELLEQGRGPAGELSCGYRRAGGDEVVEQHQGRDLRVGRVVREALVSGDGVRVDEQVALGALLEREAGLLGRLPDQPAPGRAGQVAELGVGELL